MLKIPLSLSSNLTRYPLMNHFLFLHTLYGTLIGNSYYHHALWKDALTVPDQFLKSVNIALTRKFVFFTSQPLHKQMIRYFLTGALDHAQRLYKSNLLSTPMCIHCGQVDETAKHLFWDCRAWQPTHNRYPVLMNFFSLCGTFWRN